MILWTIQEEEIYNKILSDGVYRCDPDKSWMGRDCSDSYMWMSEQMKKRIGEQPKGVTYPVWAWYQWEDERKKPDLRKERWGNGKKGDRFACMEIDIPETEVLLSDFDLWHFVLSDFLISYSEEEDTLLEKKYDTLAPSKKLLFKHKNWERVFDLTPARNDWIEIGSSIQATFWELKKEQIKKVRFFTAAK